MKKVIMILESRNLAIKPHTIIMEIVMVQVLVTLITRAFPIIKFPISTKVFYFKLIN